MSIYVYHHPDTGLRFASVAAAARVINAKRGDLKPVPAKRPAARAKVAAPAAAKAKPAAPSFYAPAVMRALATRQAEAAAAMRPRQAAEPARPDRAASDAVWDKARAANARSSWNRTFDRLGWAR